MLKSITPITVVFITIESEHPNCGLQPPCANSKYQNQHLSPKMCTLRGENSGWRVADGKLVGNGEAALVNEVEGVGTAAAYVG